MSAKNPPFTRYIRYPIMGLVMWTCTDDDPGRLTHVDMHEAIGKKIGEEPMSAGYVHNGECIDRSITLNKRAHHLDGFALIEAVRGRAL